MQMRAAVARFCPRGRTRGHCAARPADVSELNARNAHPTGRLRKERTMAESAAAATQGNSFVAELEASNLHPLWDRYQRITPIKPQPRDAPFLWRWRDIE